MPADVEVKWASGPKRAKARQISDKIWEQHEPEIRRMYPSMTLEELAAEMKRIHGFEATPRQYTARLERWGVKKYKTKRTSFHVVEMDLNLLPICDREERPFVKRLKMDDQQLSLHQGETSVITGFDPAISRQRSGSSALTVTDDDASPGNPRQHQELDILHIRQERDLSEPTVQSTVTQPNTPGQPLSQSLNIESCLRIAESVKPGRGSSSSIETENCLRVAAGYLFVMKEFSEAASLYSTLISSEQSRGAFFNNYCTTSLILSARAARSREECTFVRNMLSAVLHQPHRRTQSLVEQFLSHILSAKLSSQLGLLEVHKTSAHMSLAQSFAEAVKSERDPSSSVSLYLLAYVYYKRLQFSSPSNPQDKSSISHTDFMNFFSMQHDDHVSRSAYVLQDLKESLHWCQQASAHVESSILCSTNTSYQKGTFVNLWRMWHEGDSGAPISPDWTTEQDDFGVSLAEHLDICAEVIDLTRSTKSQEFYQSDDAITLYIQALYERVEIPQQPVLNISRHRHPHELAPILGPVPAPIYELTPIHEFVPMAKPIYSYCAPTMAPSLASSDSSYGRLRDASTAMASHRARGSYRSSTVRSTPSMTYSQYGSNPSSMSFLSEIFSSSCSITLPSPSQVPSIR